MVTNNIYHFKKKNKSLFQNNFFPFDQKNKKNVFGELVCNKAKTTEL